MNHLFNITKKELKELLTPGSIISLVVVLIVLMSVGSMMGSEMEDITAPSRVGFVNEDSGNWSQVTEDAILDFYTATYGLTEEEAKRYIVLLNGPFADGEAIIEAMSNENITAALRIGPDFSSNINSERAGIMSEYYVFENKGMSGMSSDLITLQIMAYVSNYISFTLVSGLTDEETSAFIMNPVGGGGDYRHTYVGGKLHSDVTPLEISNTVFGQTLTIPIVIMVVIMMVGSIVISSMGNEKENKTLETLLTLPVKRTTIVSGKLLASAIMGLVYGLAYMVGMVSYTNGVTGSLGEVNLSDLGLSMSAMDWVLMMVMIFLAIFSALGICMILGAFAKNFKAAQTMTLPISVLAMVPMFVMMFASWDGIPLSFQCILFAIPFTHPMMAMENLMFGNMELVFGGLIYLTIFVLITIAVTVKIYSSDILLTGLKQTKLGKVFSWKKN